MPPGGWLREVRRWACCGLRRTHRRAESRFWGAGFHHRRTHRAFVLGFWGPGIAVLWSCQRVVTVDV